MSTELTPNYHRGLDDVTRDIYAKTGEFLRAAIEIGRLLFEAKAMVEPGGWSRYIEEQLPFSHSWANNYMKLFAEFGSDQTSLFGDSQAYMNLRPSQALEIIRLPEGEREEFMATHDVENMSTRELNAIINELKATKADLQATQAGLEEAAALAESTQADAQRQAERFAEEQREARRTLESMKARAEVAEKDAKQVREQLKKAEDEEAAARAALKKAQEHPEIPDALMEQLRREAEAKAAEEATAEIRKKLATAEAALMTAERNRAEAEAREKDAREKLAAAAGESKMQNPDLMAINVLGKQIMRLWATIKDHKRDAVAEDPSNEKAVEIFQRRILDAMKEGL